MAMPQSLIKEAWMPTSYPTGPLSAVRFHLSVNDNLSIVHSVLKCADVPLTATLILDFT